MATDNTNLFHAGLREAANAIQTGCTNCGVCLHDCAFLTAYGTPGEIAGGLSLTDSKTLTRAFECSLCGLCTTLCPQGLEVRPLFLEMRREAVSRGLASYSEHKPLLTYERLGTSRRFSLYQLPTGCTTVFFPGCGLSGTRPKRVKEIFAHLREVDPVVGIVLDCCMKPSHMLGRKAHADIIFEEMNNWLVQQGVEEVLVACPNCQSMFASLGRSLRVRTVWEVLSEAKAPFQKVSGKVTVHDPCPVRDAEPVHKAVRTLLERQGLVVEEMAHSGKTTICCGLGGAVNLLNPDLSASWGNLRKKEAAGRRIITYCAGCVNSLQSQTPSSHLADILYDPHQALVGKVKVTQGPLTYLNRLLLKRTYKRQEGFAVTRERTFIPETEPKKNRWKPLIVLTLLIAVITGVHLSGATQYLQQGKLRELISAHGALAPAIYMLIYSLAPVLFLPGLPITIVGGILFGPFWGVVYTITGSTIGASLAFLVARYGARDWIASKLTSPRWEKLDSEVARHGWKVVAFTRLIPAFPFNLLNYAFGLTKIPFAHYVVATFFCMLPACIAFIVFSSSLLDLIRGHVSPTALIGIILIAIVSLIPLIYRRFKGRGSEGEGAG